MNIAHGKLADEFIFTISVVDMFYYKRNIGEIDIKSGFVDGPNDGGIDFIFSDTETLYLIQGKSTDFLSIEDIKNAFRKMEETICNFEDKKYDQYSKALKSAFLNAWDDLNDDKNIELVLFTNTVINEEMQKQISDFAKSDKFNNYKINVYGKEEIEEKDALLYSDSDLIDEGFIEIVLNEENKSNILSYNEDGIIVNAKASSLKNLYNKYGKTGLFSYNLREHISQKNVDDAIDNTIRTDKDQFWFFNNGITIGCEDFVRDGNRIKIYGFSIINGAQTTTKIGESKLINGDYDFALVCKIVRTKNSFEKDENFISKISEASNSQKPIKQRDLKSNAIEQKRLQNGCANNGKYSLAVEIKRGVKPKNLKKVEKWQRVTNEYIGQLIYACIFQRPGPARNSKNTMFSSSKLYKQLFLRKHDYNTLYDLVRLGNTYDEFVIEQSKKSDNLDYIAIIKNGKLTVLAVALYLLKKEKGIIIDYTGEQLHKDNLSGLLITDYPKDDLDEKLYQLFQFIVRQLQRIYEMKKEAMKITSYSNYFKSEQIYDIILKEFDELDDYDKGKLSEFMTVFTEKAQKAVE